MGFGMKNIGAGLLNESSKELKIAKMKITYLFIDKIQPNKKNQYSMEAIEDLAEAIYIAGGLEQPLVVLPEDETGNYTLLTGHRRLKAVRFLVETGRWNIDVLPCMIRRMEDIALPLNAEEKETFSILITNQYRDKTDGDKLFEMRELKQIFTKLKKEGITEYTFGVDNTGTEVKKGLNKKTRELVADQMQISPAQVGIFEKVDKNGTPKVIKAVNENKVNVAQAKHIVDLLPEEQDAVIDSLEKEKSPLTAQAVKQGIKDVKEKKLVTKDVESSSKQNTNMEYNITKYGFEKDIEEIKVLLKKDVKITKAQYFEYLKHIDAIYRILAI